MSMWNIFKIKLVHQINKKKLYQIKMGFLKVHKCLIAAEQKESGEFVLENLEKK